MGHIWNCLQHDLCGVKKKSLSWDQCDSQSHELYLPIGLNLNLKIPSSDSDNAFFVLSLFLLTDSHCVCKLCSFWWSNLAKHREGSCLGLWREDGPENQSSFFFSACWAQSECWSFRPSAHPGWPEGKGKGRGKQQKEGSRVEGEKGAKVLQMETRV